MRQTTLRLDLEHFRSRVLQDALAEACAAYWKRRAETLEGCLSRPGDFTGSATPEEIKSRDARIRDDVTRCRAHARLMADDTGISNDVRNVLAEVA
jgi:hypothetical protein